MPKTLSVGEGAISHIKANDRNVRRPPAVAQHEPFGTRVLAQTPRKFDWLARW